MSVNTWRRLFLSTLVLFVCGCGGGDNPNAKKVTISQGVWGDVWFWDGNHMPGPVNDLKSNGPITAVSRDIYIYKPTTVSDTTKDSSGVFYSTISTELVATVTSDAEGFYQAELPAGQYSLFVQESGGLYANLTDSNGILNPVTVESDMATQLRIDITYAASF